MPFLPELLPATYLPFNVTEQDTLKISDYDFPPGTKVSIGGGRRITKTQIDGAKGSVKEVAGQADWTVSISFLILSDSYLFAVPGVTGTGKTMIQELKTLRRLLEGNSSLPIINFRLNSLGIKQVLIERWNIPDSNQYHQPVSLECISDNEYDLILENAIEERS